jgi:acetyl esterase/lipase
MKSQIELSALRRALIIAWLIVSTPTFLIWIWMNSGIKPDKQIILGPRLDVYLAKHPTGDGAILVCPGGGYEQLSWLEKDVVGQWLKDNGINAFVLNYRLPKQFPFPASIQDATLAIRYLRTNAASFHISPAKIAILGFSAGGHLASTIATHYQPGDPDSEDPLLRVSSRPDFQILIYPVITMNDQYTHKGSKRHLIGEMAPDSLVKKYSNERQVNADTPPAFVYHATTDKTVDVKNSDLYVESLKKSHVPVEYVRVCLPTRAFGGHGIGIDPSWTIPLLKWLEKNQF